MKDMSKWGLLGVEAKISLVGKFELNINVTSNGTLTVTYLGVEYTFIIKSGVIDDAFYTIGDSGNKCFSTDFSTDGKTSDLIHYDPEVDDTSFYTKEWREELRGDI